MMTLGNEPLMTVREAIAKVQGKPVDDSTAWRWYTQGSKAKSGRVVKLEVVRFGGRYLTSTEAVERFVERLTEVTESPKETPLQRQRRIARDQAELQAELRKGKSRTNGRARAQRTVG